MSALAPAEAYRLWAPSYSEETAISYLENELVSAMTPPLAGLRLLDAGCGTGRRMRGCGAATAVGLEPSRAMLAAGKAPAGETPCHRFVVGDVREIPLAARAFDVVWCRLVLGHLPSIEGAYAELARVADTAALVIVSDFHPAAVDAGHQRSFRRGGDVVEVEHHVHRPANHIQAAQAAGLDLCEMRDAKIGHDVRSFYESAGLLEAYSDHLGLPVVLGLMFRRER